MANDKKVEPGLYVRAGKRATSYSTIVDGQRIKLGKTLDESRAALYKLRGVDAPKPSDTIEEMCRLFIADQRELLKSGDNNALSARTIDQYEAMLKRSVFPYCGSMEPRAFKATHKAQYLSTRRKGNAALGMKPAPTGANREMAALGSAFNYGLTIGMVDANPCLGVRRNKERPRTRKPSIAEVNEFLAFAKTQGKGKYMVALIGALVGVMGRRRAEFIRLTREAVVDRGLRCKDSKTKPGEPERFYLVKWSPLLKQIIAEAAAIYPKLDTEFLFPTRSGEPYTDDGYSSNANKLQRAWEAQGGLRFRAHDLRALYVSLMLDADKNPNTHRNTQTMMDVYDRRTEIEVDPLA